MEEPDLLAVFAALLEVSNEQDEWNVQEISQRADIDPEQTELILDELAHMGFVKKECGRWYPGLDLK